MIAYIDIVMTTGPGPDGEFVETEDDQGRSVGADHGLHWVQPAVGDLYWRLRVPASAFGRPDPSALSPRQIDDLAALVDPEMFKGTPDDYLHAPALARRNAARGVVLRIIDAATRT